MLGLSEKRPRTEGPPEFLDKSLGLLGESIASEPVPIFQAQNEGRSVSHLALRQKQVEDLLEGRQPQNYMLGEAAE
jgi:Flp pilus assembly CpaE family ATPase